MQLEHSASKYIWKSQYQSWDIGPYLHQALSDVEACTDDVKISFVMVIGGIWGTGYYCISPPMGLQDSQSAQTPDETNKDQSSNFQKKVPCYLTSSYLIVMDLDSLHAFFLPSYLLGSCIFITIQIQILDFRLQYIQLAIAQS